MKIEFKACRDFMGNSRISKRRAKRRWLRLPKEMQKIESWVKPGFKVSFNGRYLVTIELRQSEYSSDFRVYRVSTPLSPYWEEFYREVVASCRHFTRNEIAEARLEEAKKVRELQQFYASIDASK